MVPSRYNLFEVRNGVASYKFNLMQMNYACRMWGLCGIKCVYYVVALSHVI